MKEKAVWVRYQLPALLWAGVIFVASSIPAASFPNLPIFRFDKALHLVVFFVFALLTERALRHQSQFPTLSRHSRLLCLITTLLYGAFDEFHQSFVPGRTPDVFDLTADVLGAVLFLLFFWLWWTRRTKQALPH